MIPTRIRWYTLGQRRLRVLLVLLLLLWGCGTARLRQQSSTRLGLLNGQPSWILRQLGEQILVQAYLVSPQDLIIRFQHRAYPEYPLALHSVGVMGMQFDSPKMELEAYQRTRLRQGPLYRGDRETTKRDLIYVTDVREIGDSTVHFVGVPMWLIVTCAHRSSEEMYRDTLTLYFRE